MKNRGGTSRSVPEFSGFSFQMELLMTIARQVEGWYAERKEDLAKVFSNVRIGSVNPDHPGGEIGIAVEGPSIVASISIFNSGLITIPAIEKSSKRHFVLDHRVLAPDEDLALALDRYMEQIAH
jgi:hypothetical protein